MQLQLKKKAGGEPVITFVRDDGSGTSGRLGTGGFGAVHDLTHFVVETTLGLRQGFYGLLADGWDIPDFAAKGHAARLPDEAIVVECIVGQLTNAIFAGNVPAADEFNWLVAEAVRAVRPRAAAPAVSAAVLAAMRQQVDAHLAAWRALPVGQTLTLAFAPPVRA